MYPSSNSNGNTSFSSSNQPRTASFSCNYNNGNHSKPSQEHYHPPSSSSFHLHYPNYIPLEDEPIFRELFQPQQVPFSNDHNHHNTVTVTLEHSTRTTTTNVQSTMEKCGDSNGKFVTADGGDQSKSHVILKNSCVTKRSSKKDRHSKINTARGPRDRRMRLSLDVAKKFFRLQDMLGFDKASNTIEWLLMKSKPAIQGLLPHQLNQSCSFMGVSNSASSASECEVLSVTDDQSMEKTGDDQVIIMAKAKSSSCSSNKEKKKIARGLGKSPYIHHSLAKEARERARERARVRTTEKRNNKLGCGGAGGDQYPKFRPCLDQGMDQNVNRLGSWSPFGENQVQITDQPENPSSHFQFKQGIVGDYSSLMTGNWNPSFLFNLSA